MDFAFKVKLLHKRGVLSFEKVTKFLIHFVQSNLKDLNTVSNFSLLLYQLSLHFWVNYRMYFKSTKYNYENEKMNHLRMKKEYFPSSSRSFSFMYLYDINVHLSVWAIVLIYPLRLRNHLKYWRIKIREKKSREPLCYLCTGSFVDFCVSAVRIWNIRSTSHKTTYTNYRISSKDLQI